MARPAQPVYLGMTDEVAAGLRYRAQQIADGAIESPVGIVSVEFMADGRCIVKSYGPDYENRREAVVAILDAATTLLTQDSH